MASKLPPFPSTSTSTTVDYHPTTTTTTTHHRGAERTPLLVTKDSSYGGGDEDITGAGASEEDGLDNHNTNHNSNNHNNNNSSSAILLLTTTKEGTACVKNVGINLAKTAAGTGILALPFACKEGGLLLFIFGTLAIAIWNVFGLKRLCDCFILLVEMMTPISQPQSTAVTSTTTTTRQQQQQKQQQRRQRIRQVSYHQQHKRPPPPAGTATLGKIAYYACGDTGLVVLDIMLLLLLCGIVIAYECAILAFSKGTPFTTSSNIVDAVILATLMVPLCLVDDLSNLSRLSRLGLVILALTMLVIAGYGIRGTYFNDNDISDNSYGNNTNTANTNPFHLLPPNGLAGISHWFGCVVFGFGIVPLTFNFRESMACPEKLPTAALVSMLLVAAAYIVTGISLLALYPDITDDVLSEIPSGGLATLTRLAMIVVVMATAPLLIVPCAEIIEGKIHHDGQVHPKTVLIARACICLCTVSISVMLPGFVTVLAFVGCFSVALVSFCVPPFLHMVLLFQKRNFDILVAAEGDDDDNDESHHDHHHHHHKVPFPFFALTIDLITFLSGVATTVITTFITFQKMIETEPSE